MEADIDRNPEALRRILEHMPEMVLVVDPDAVIQYINRVEEGYDRDQVIGSRADEILTPEAKVVFWTALETLLEDGEPQEYDSEVVAPDGGIQWYRSRMVPLRNDGEIPGAIVITVNVTELKAAEAEAEQLRKLLPICSWCERIQSEEGAWETIETYLGRKEETTVSHGLCPDCYERQFEEAGEPTSGENGSAA